MLAGLNANIWDQGDDIKALGRGDATVDPARLADPAIPLTNLS